ncbi:acyltransferase [Streptomyces sp. NPDC056169]|uniref:acyltransferase n=1 Tax=Streptomyces sp. NPDC056169 TaxID=3345734 RepID=UPI0035E0DE65
MMGTEEVLRLTVAALMARSGERQGDLAAGIGQSQAQVSRKQAGRQHWSLEDVDLLAAHYRLHVLDLLAGPTHAAGVLHGSVSSLQQAGAQPLAMQLPAHTGTPAPTVTAVADEAAALEREHPGAVADLVRDSRDPAVYGQPGTPAPAVAGEPTSAVQQQSAALVPPTPDRVPAPASASKTPARPCVLCGQPARGELDGFPQHLTAEECAQAVAVASASPAAVPQPPATKVSAPVVLPPVAVPETTAAAPAAPVASAMPVVPAAGPRGSAPGYASGTLVEQITGRVHEVMGERSGDMEAAQAELIKAAIPDVMTLLKASRVGGRYEHSEFPPTQEILRKKSQKGADEIWEGRPKWRNAELFAAAKRGERIEVTALDMNAAYLSALKCWLPIGQLREDTSGVHDPKKAGVHLITPPAWDHTDIPNPLGNRMEPGELWVSESTLRLLLDCARQDLTGAPVIHRSLVSGATEALLEKLRRALAEARKTALAENDELTVAYVKAMYSKLVSTIGESTANRELRRPDWMHIIRAKAFANLWMKAHKAHKAGLQVVEISGTDELHIAGDWRTVFSEGRDLNQVKEKDTYILGGRR